MASSTRQHSPPPVPRRSQRLPQIDGDVVRIPFYNRFRAADVPDGFHPLPQGWGLAPAALTVTPAATLQPDHHPNAHTPGWQSGTNDAGEFLRDARIVGTVPAASHLPAFSLRLPCSLVSAFGSSPTHLCARRALFWIWLVVACIGISEALVAGNAVTDAFQRRPANRGDRERTTKRGCDALFVRHDGHVEPFRQRDLDLAKALQQPRTIPDVASVASAVPMRFFLYLLPAFLFLLVYARFIYAGYHFFFSRHPDRGGGRRGAAHGSAFRPAKSSRGIEDQSRASLQSAAFA